MNVRITDSDIASNAPRSKAETEFFNISVLPVKDARPRPMIGDINGAINMAPMITAGESVIKPRVAILDDSMTNRKKSKPGVTASDISSITSLRLSAGSLLMINFCH